MWKWIKIPKIGAFIAFFMPWLTVSCSSMQVASATGWQLAVGGYSHAASDIASKAPPPGSGNGWLLLAILLIVAGIWIAFLKPSKQRSLRAAIISGVALLFVWIGTARYSTPALIAEASKNGGFSGSVDQASAAMIQFRWEIGFWLTVVALLAGCVMAALTYLEDAAVSESPIRRTADNKAR